MTLRDTAQRKRLFPKARWFAKQVLVRWDLLRHRNDESIRRWRRALVGARAGHVVIPSVAMESTRREARDFAARGLVRAGDRVLDVGAGNGRQAIGLVELGVGSYTGLEVVKRSVEFANAAFSTLDNVRFDWLDVRNPMYNPKGAQAPDEVAFPYPDESFDFVVALSLYTHLEHLVDAARYVSETARVLRAAGGAFMTFFKSPPNVATSSAVRTVFAERDILRIVGEHFVIEDAAGCETTAFHNQWRLYLRKR
jgi:ubiquinone/menaquinone biosynthesis C-methylase UbiE